MEMSDNEGAGLEGAMAVGGNNVQGGQIWSRDHIINLGPLVLKTLWYTFSFYFRFSCCPFYFKPEEATVFWCVTSL